MKTDIMKLGTEGLCTVEYPENLKIAVGAAMARWQEVCTLPEEVRICFPYNANKGMGVGYELKKTPGSTLDLKEDFHYTRRAQAWLAEQARKIGNPDIIDFVASLAELDKIMAPFVQSFADELESAYGLPGFADEIQGGEWFIRFLHYFDGAQLGEEIAKAHADKSGFTLHLFESAPGLQYLDRSFVWRDVEMGEGKTVIIPGMRGQRGSEGKLKATFHRVVATLDTAQTGRFSAVAFIHPDVRVPQYDKDGAGRLQEMKPGFNYEMLFEEFKRFFK
jgi:isopenicillin N synthase-like dioxygenase